MLQFHENPQTDGVSEETAIWVNFIYQIGNPKFILRILSQSLETPYVEFLKDPFYDHSFYCYI